MEKRNTRQQLSSVFKGLRDEREKEDGEASRVKGEIFVLFFGRD